jgi:hypothetical protein
MSVSVDIQKPHGNLSAAVYDVVVVGAGPYGLSVAAHLLRKALKVAVFGKPLQLWQDNMPAGMLLRSFWWASNLSDPQKKCSLSHYFGAHNLKPSYPLPIETFIDYGLWFQRQMVPAVDETYVSMIERRDGHFSLLLADGRIIQCRVVVMAPGLHYYTYRPQEYDSLPEELVSHTAHHNRFDRFSGEEVVIIGGGQSALESAALLHERGAHVTLVSRSPLHWLSEEKDLDERTLLQRMRHPRAGIAPGWFNWGLENMPYVFHQLPRGVKDRLLRGRGRYGPAGSAWLRPRVLDKVTLLEGVSVLDAQTRRGGVALKLSNGNVLKADHLLLATGYRVNVWRLPMLSPTLLSRVRTYYNAPVLNQRFESSVAGLYFVGISSVSSFGPFYRFVVGTEAAARRVAESVVQQVAQMR